VPGPAQGLLAGFDRGARSRALGDPWPASRPVSPPGQPGSDRAPL